MKAALCALCLAGAAAAADPIELDSVKILMLDPNNVSSRDISMFPPSARPDRFRLSRVEALLREPFRLGEVTSEIMRRTASEAGPARLPIHPDSLWPLLDAPASGNGGVTATAAPAGVAAAAQPAPSVAPATQAAPVDTSAHRRAHGSDSSGPEHDLALVRAGLKEHTAGLSAEETHFLYSEAPGLFLQDEEDTTLTPVQSELKREEDDARTRRVMEVADRLHREGLARAAAAAWRLETWLIGEVRAGRAAQAAARLKRAGGNDIPVHLGGPGPDRHTVGQGIWIDPGGDDEYAFKGPGKPGSFTLVVDGGGEDLYLSKDSLATGAGNLGVSLVADLGGSDRYLGRNFAWGAALFGYASLFDAAGHDTYEGRCASQGFGFFGIGVLQDESGNDVYTASLLSQGAAATRGMGALLDRTGDDRYLARPTFKDDLRYSDHYIQMVQGFATGFSPDFGGGIGLLRDGAGNDVYLADIFGQGSAYWYSLGMLIDEGGDDRYEAHQYAQGAGVHIAVGAALDFGGNDHRISKGVSQGCGHDYGFGYLYDRSGDDSYFAVDMSQGAGSANGLGILQDASGNDFYTTGNPDMALGHADLRRDRGSFGFFLDRGGKDKYTRPRSEGAAWRISDGKIKGNGFGLDR